MLAATIKGVKRFFHISFVDLQHVVRIILTTGRGFLASNSSGFAGVRIEPEPASGAPIRRVRYNAKVGQHTRRPGPGLTNLFRRPLSNPLSNPQLNPTPTPPTQPFYA